MNCIQRKSAAIKGFRLTFLFLLGCYCVGSTALAFAQQPAVHTFPGGGLTPISATPYGELAFEPSVISTPIGTGAAGYSGDGGAPSGAQLSGPWGLSYDVANDLYIGDMNNLVLRFITYGSGTIQSRVSSGIQTGPEQVAVDAGGDIFVNDGGNQIVELLPPSQGPQPEIVYPPGTGNHNYIIIDSSYGLGTPTGVAVDTAGNLYVSDSSNAQIEQLTPGAQTLSVLAGGGVSEPCTNFAVTNATQATFNSPAGIWVDALGNIYIIDCNSIQVIYSAGTQVASLIALENPGTVAQAGWIYPLAGIPGSTQGFAGNGSLASSATFNSPQGITTDPAGNIYVADSGNYVIRKIDVTTGFISTVAGSNSNGYTGDGGSALSAQLDSVSSVALDAMGNIYAALPTDNVVREVGSNGILTFPAQSVNSTGAALTISVVNRGNAPITFSAAPIMSGDFSLSTGNNCGAFNSTLAIGASCALSIVFTPTYQGTRQGSLTLSDNAYPNEGQTSHQILLSGIGTTGTNPSAIVLATSVNPSLLGSTVLLTASVSSTTGGAPTGIVTFSSNGGVIGMSQVTNGIATLNNSTLALGTDSLLASYSGDSNYQSNLSNTLNEQIQSPPVLTQSSLVVNTSNANSAFGAPVIFQVTALASDGTFPTGVVNLFDGSTQIGAAVLRSGTGSVYSANLTPGLHQIYANYAGDNLHSSAVGMLTNGQTIQNTPPVVTVLLSPNLVTAGTTVTANVSVTSAPGYQAAGGITCTEPGISSVSGTLGPNAQISLQLQSLPVGSDLVTCAFTSSTNGGTSSGTATATIVPLGDASTGSMTASRYGHNAAILSNGQVLVMGGATEDGIYANDVVSSAELYSPSSGTFAYTGSMNVPRFYAASTNLSDGSVLITGGSQDATLNATAEYYNPATSQFMEVGNMTTVRSQHTATLLPNGQVLVAGGVTNNGITRTAELYSPANTSFAATGQMQYSRANSSAVLLSTGSVFVVGGCTDNSQGNVVLSETEIYNPQSASFSAGPSLPWAAEGITTTNLSDGTVLITGGSSLTGQTLYASAAVFDPVANTLTTVGSMSTARAFHTATLLSNGTVLIAGGFSGANFSNATASLEIYDPGTKQFSSAGTMQTARVHHTATALGNSVLIAGGVGNNSNDAILASSEIYNPATPAEGLVDLKFIVVGVTYAPPGSGSTVVYGSTSSVASTTTISDETASSTSLTVTDTAGATYSLGLGSLATFGATSTLTGTTGYEYDSTSSTMTVITTTTGLSITSPGPTNSSIGVDHDYDLIYVWLNPEIAIDFPPSSASTPILNWRALAYQGCDSTHVVDCDPNNYGNPDIVAIPALCFKDPYLPPACSQWQPLLNRTWDSTGNGALTFADYTTILNKDPFMVSPNYNPASDTTNAVTEVNGSLQFPLPVPGQGSQTFTGTVGGSTAITTSQTITRKYSVSFTLNNQLSGGFIADLLSSISVTAGNVWTQTDVNSTATTNTSTATYNVKTPAATDTYSGPIIFDVWHDNYYGTFMFYAPTRPLVAAGSIGTSSASVSFPGTVTLGSASQPQVLTFTNNFPVPLTMSATTFAPMLTAVTFSTQSFSVVSDGCSTLTLQPQQTCNVSIQFSPVATDLPTSAPTAVSGTMIVTGIENAAGSTNVMIPIQIPLSGTGVI